MACIMLLEDDEALRGALGELFEREGYDVVTAGSLREARAAMSAQIDLAVMDVSLPDGDGVSLCREWRKSGLETPVLFLTARDDEVDVVRGLDAGAGDYVTKPFRMQELLSRIRAQLRIGAGKAAKGGFVRGEFLIDQEHMTVKRAGQALNLTLTEYRICVLLTANKSIVPRARLLEALWDDGARYVDDNTLSVHVSRLRDKVGSGHIRTLRGVGYQWVD